MRRIENRVVFTQVFRVGDAKRQFAGFQDLDRAGKLGVGLLGALGRGGFFCVFGQIVVEQDLRLRGVDRCREQYIHHAEHEAEKNAEGHDP